MLVFGSKGKIMRIRKWVACGLLAAAGFASSQSAAFAQGKRKVIIDQDCAGPGGTDMQAILALVNSPQTEVLGITVLTGDAWRDEEVQHTLRLLEIIGRTDIPVVPGAIFPVVNSKEYIAKWETLYGKVVYQGAWNYAKGYAVHGPYDIPPMPEGRRQQGFHGRRRAIHGTHGAPISARSDDLRGGADDGSGAGLGS